METQGSFSMKSYIGDIPNINVRDYQRKRVYKAEEQCSFWRTPETLAITEVDNLITIISEVFGIERPTLDLGNEVEKSTAYATPSLIVLPFPIAKSLPFICHEMSHVINYQRGPADHHGSNFATAYLEVVKTVMGDEEFDELEGSFKDHKVTYKEVISI